MNPLLAFAAAFAGYLLGSFSAARLVGKIAIPRQDITKTEFAVPGTDEKMVMSAVSATSISLRAGPRLGCLTTILDMLKVTLPTLAFRLLYPNAPYFLIAALMGMVGHNWPIYHGFKGGRGFSAVFGGMWVIDWIAIFATSLGGMLFGLLIFRDVLIAYMAGMWLMIPWLWFRFHDLSYLAYAVAINVIFAIAMLPELELYFKLKREGKIDLVSSLQTTEMGRVAKMAKRLGLIKDI
jgi:glycerol-3-phosphate acyltransferase PlsY